MLGATELVDVDGLSIGYHRAGSGPPLMLLHGYVGDGLATWRPQIERLSEAFTVVAWDAPGAGRSSDPPDQFGMAGYADSLRAFIDRLGLDRPHVAGLSFGGALAIEFCRRHPGVTRSLVLASAYAGWAGSLPIEIVDQRLGQAMALSDLSPDEFSATLLPTMFERAPRTLVDPFDAAMRRFHPTGFRAMASASAENLRDALPHVTVPTLLVYGDQDVRAPLGVAEDLHTAIPGSSLVVIPGAGHVCNLDAADQFNAAVLRFLR